jgi:hypothetical protein
MTENKKKDLVSVQDFILNNPQALNEVGDTLDGTVYDWNDDEEMKNVLDSPE